MPSIILFPHEARAAAAGTLRQIWRPIVSVKSLGAVTEFQRSDTRGYDWIMRDRRMLWNDLRHDDLLQRGPFRPGDVLACREAWRIGAWRDSVDDPPCFAVDYTASPELCRTPWIMVEDDAEAEKWRERTLSELTRKNTPRAMDGSFRWEPGQGPLSWRSPATMPAWAVRSHVKPLTVDVKRVQEMSMEDAKAWGSFLGRCSCPEMQRPPRPGLESMFRQTGCYIHGEEVKRLWNSHFARRGLGWDKNPWCWNYTVEQAGRPS